MTITSDTTVDTIDALLQSEDGTCARALACVDQDGAICDSYGQPLRYDGTTEIKGWGELDGPAIRYAGAGRWRLLVPRSRK